MGPGQRLPHQPQHPTHLITGHPDIAATGVDDPLPPNLQLRIGSLLGATSTASLTTRSYCWTHLANGLDEALPGNPASLPGNPASLTCSLLIAATVRLRKG